MTGGSEGPPLDVGRSASDVGQGADPGGIRRGQLVVVEGSYALYALIRDLCYVFL